MGAKACRCLIKDSRDESPPKTRASDTNPPGRQRESENNEDDMKIIGEVDVGGWDEDTIAKKRECVNETEWDLIGGWMDRQDDERGPRQKKRSLIDQNQAKKWDTEKHHGDYCLSQE